MKIENCLKDALDSFYQREFDETVPEAAYDDPRRILIAESNPEDHEEIQVRAYANLEDMTIDYRNQIQKTKNDVWFMNYASAPAEVF